VSGLTGKRKGTGMKKEKGRERGTEPEIEIENVEAVVAVNMTDLTVHHLQDLLVVPCHLIDIPAISADHQLLCLIVIIAVVAVTVEVAATTTTIHPPVPQWRVVIAITELNKHNHLALNCQHSLSMNTKHHLDDIVMVRFLPIQYS